MDPTAPDIPTIRRASTRPRAPALAAAAAALALLVRPPAAPAQAASSTDSVAARVGLEEAVALFRENGLELRLARHRYRAEAHRAGQRGAYPNPSFSLVREDLSRTAGEYSETTVSLSQPLEWPGQTLARSRASEQARTAARWEYRADSLRLAGRVRESYLQAAEAERRADLLAEVADVFGEAVADGRTRHAEGDISGYELRRLRLEETRIVRELAAARIERDAARRELAGLILPGSDTVAVATRGLPEGTPPSVERAEVLEGALDRPAVVAARHALEAAGARARAASLGRIPRLDLTGGYKTQSDDFGGPVLGLSVTLPVLDRETGAARAADAARSASALRLRLEQRRARNRALRALDRYRSVRRRSEALEERLLAPSTDLLEIARTGYVAGEMELFQLLDGADAYLEARRTALELRADLWASFFELRRAMGGRR